MIVILLPLAVAILGLLMFVLAPPPRPKVSRVGEILFFAGTLATLLHLSARLLQLP
jgi:hypothetical protein